MHNPHLQRRVKVIVEEMIDGQVVSTSVDEKVQDLNWPENQTFKPCQLLVMGVFILSEVLHVFVFLSGFSEKYMYCIQYTQVYTMLSGFVSG